ncbi:hypothetical protein KFE25_013874 [Diacronema lutheri]|uniref:Glycosyltransferase subfamily 4-like N-terminal domain-containing protein n=1 Tax=Diacronema lutheri TaxID=2081491 RepID=A0A8J6C9Q8_DIALT|nr:hypothetical protein KFE25_013874 [Diacronema lutheri]
MAVGAERDRLLRVLVLALELAEPIFSGNGVYGRSIVEALLRRGASVLIVCAGPERPPDARPPELPASLRGAGLAGIVQVPLRSWGRLDRHSGWEQWAHGAAATAAPHVRHFAPDVVLAVDWTAMAAADALLPAAGLRARPPIAFACFRVFAASEGTSAADRAFYAAREAAAQRDASLTIAISTVDARLLRELQYGDGARAPPGRGAASIAPIVVLNPPLRAEIAAIANRTAVRNGSGERTLLLYCGRLAAEKNVLAFARAVALAAPALRALGVRPALVGGGADAQLVRAARDAVRDAFADALLLDFVQPAQLAPLLERTLLFVHPARYESYGMMLVEAAALGAPLLLDERGDIGASDLLPLGSHAYGADMGSAEALAATLRELVPALVREQRDGDGAQPARAADRARPSPSRAVAAAARAAALARGLDEFAAELTQLLQGMLAAHAAADGARSVERAVCDARADADSCVALNTCAEAVAS